MGLTVTLVRHGNTDANNERWIQGQVGKQLKICFSKVLIFFSSSVDTELNTVGLDQANRCGHRLKDEQFQHVYCSDLKRCKQVSFIKPLVSFFVLFPYYDTTDSSSHCKLPT